MLYILQTTYVIPKLITGKKWAVMYFFHLNSKHLTSAVKSIFFEL